MSRARRTTRMRVVISFQGIETVIGNLTAIGEKAPANLQKLTTKLSEDTLSAWKRATPVRSGRMQAADLSEVGALAFTLMNSTRYYDWVSKGHNTPMGWRTKRGYRPAKRRSHVAGRKITEKAVEFIESNISNYLSKFLDDV